MSRVWPRRPVERARRLADRQRRWLARGLHRLGQPREGEKVPVFVAGCHRSGTSMIMRILERSPHLWVHHESRRSLAFHNFRLRSGEVLERVIDWSPAEWVAFKPVCDAHLADRLLERFPGARVLWPYRRYPDVANSAVRKWGEHHKDIIRAISRGEWSWLGWRGERLSPEVVDRITSLYREDMSLEEAAALQWYLRNHFYFELGLERDPRVMLFSYEHMVSEPEQAFDRLFRFLGDCPTTGLDLKSVSRRSLGKAPFPAIDREIERMCEELMQRLVSG